MAVTGTKRPEAAKPATKGRPRLGAAPLSQAERSRRARARRKAQPQPVKDSAELFRDLCARRGVVAAFDRALAMECVNALADGRLSEALKAMDALPPVVRTESSSLSSGMSAVKQHFLQLIQNAIAGDRLELARRAERGDELSERERLLLRLHELDEPPPDEADAPTDEVTALRLEVAQLRARLGEAPPPQIESAPALTAQTDQPKVITPSVGDITPPSEFGVVRTGAQRPPMSADFARYKPGARKPPLDLKAEPAAAPAPRSWDETEDAARWREWRDSGGYERDGHLFW
jgi:hypothetical protein